MEGRLKDDATTLGVGDKIFWLGERNGQRAMPAFDALALPSRYEGLPYVILEAFAAGLPIITTSASASRTLVHDKQNGLVVPPDDVHLLAVAIEELFSSKSLLTEMASASRSSAQNYLLPRMIRATEQVYRSLLKAA